MVLFCEADDISMISEKLKNNKKIKKMTDRITNQQERKTPKNKHSTEPREKGRAQTQAQCEKRKNQRPPTSTTIILSSSVAASDV